MRDFAPDTFQQLHRIVLGVAQGMSVKSGYNRLYRLFLESMNQVSSEAAVAFGGPFAQMTQLCRQYDFMAHYNHLNAFRNRARNLHDFSDEVLQIAWKADFSVVARFLSAIFCRPLPQELEQMLAEDVHTVPESEATYRQDDAFRRVMRVVVEQVGDEYFDARDERQGMCVKVWYAAKNYYGDWTYLRQMLHTGTQVNLVHPYEHDGVWYAELYIVEPDCLIDVSAIAACFQEYGASSWQYQLAKIKPVEITPDILLGNFAGQLLDEAIYNEQPLTYAQSIQHFFQQNALSVAACTDLDEKFHREARLQKENLQRLVHQIFPTDRTIDIAQVLLEPSFFCEMLGVQGRIDLLQENLRVLMEQKSGKCDEFRHAHREKHYVQVLLYLAYLHYAFGIDNRDVSLYLLYSKYSGRDGLLKEGPAPALLFDALRIRNEIAVQEVGMAEEDVIDWAAFDAETLHEKNKAAKLWKDYALPKIEALLQPLRSLSDVESAYFRHVFGFIQREKVLAKMGGTGQRREVGGMAALWNATLEERVDSGDILFGLSLVIPEKEDSISEPACNGSAIKEPMSGIEDVILLPPSAASDTDRRIAECSNFRKGDVVVIYAYDRNSEPDVRSTLVMRATITHITAESVGLHLRAPQRNRRVFEKSPRFAWAMEHDTVEAGFTQLFRGLYAFMTMHNAERRSIVLGQKEPRTDTSYVLKGTYGEHAAMVERAMQARDFFLLIGPPGTGKTTTGLVNILKECLLSGERGILLSAYTNRAVEEICGKLVKNGLDFIRIGSAAHADAATQPYLLSERVKQCSNVAQVRQLIEESRIVVGTTAAFSSVPHLFRMKHFETAIIDEASQILEPHLYHLLAADDGKGIGRFVLIGDHKQLPAVVKQTAQASAVQEEALKKLGIDNTACSLFERLLQHCTSDSNLVWQLEKQWRMHPDVAAFSNKYFYHNRLQAGGAEHQRTDANDAFIKNRLCFIDVKKQADTAEDLLVSDKVNAAEAKKTAEMVKRLCDDAKNKGEKMPEIGIIVPFRNQISAIREHLQPIAHEYPEVEAITIDTVERYQGSERDFIIYSTTICRPQQLYFLCGQTFEDETGSIIDRKLNVALTRARRQTIVLGDADILRCNSVYRAMIDFCCQK